MKRTHTQNKQTFKTALQALDPNYRGPRNKEKPKEKEEKSINHPSHTEFFFVFFSFLLQK